MISGGVRAIAAACVVSVCVTFAPSVEAQTGGIGNVINAPAALENMRARQKALFDELIDKPDDLDLMFEYAKVSIQLEDYEAAISTLERMLIYRQDLSRVRLELAVAYFNLGSYAASELYFNQVLEDPQTPDIVRQRINRYKEVIACRTRKSAISVLANVGITHSTNATLGPQDNEVLLLGNVANPVSGQKEADTGTRVLVNLSHVYDLQQEDDDVWRTDASFFGLRYFDTEEGNILFTRVRTGPRLSLDEKQFGPKARPYLEGQFLMSEDRPLFFGFGVGAEISDTLSPIISVYGDVGLRYRNYFDSAFSDEDAYTFYASGGLAYIPFRDLVIRGTGIFEIDEADGEQNSNIELGLRVSGEYQYDSGLDWVDRKWSVSGFAEVRHRIFEQADPIIAPGITRRDVDFRGGLSHVFSLQQGFGIQVDVDGLYRASNIINFDLDNISTTVSLQYRM